MSPQKTGISALKKAYKTTGYALKNNPRLFIPFVISGLIQFIILIFLYLMPRQPLRTVFGPMIMTFWREEFLHYPANFFLLPKLTFLSNMFLSVILGSILTATAVAMVFNVYTKKHSRLKDVFKSVLPQYLSFFIVVLTFTALFYFLTKLIIINLSLYFRSGRQTLLFFDAAAWTRTILLILNFILALILQAAFIYAIPILIIEKQKILKAIWSSFVLLKRRFLSTLILVGLPMLLYIPINVLMSNTEVLIDKFFPEIILWLLAIGSFINALIIDPIITVSATTFYLINKEEKKDK